MYYNVAGVNRIERPNWRFGTPWSVRCPGPVYQAMRTQRPPIALLHPVM
eukprot:COSAG06_NODE_56138_length_286_cov_0.823529_1_plen_48_part_01